MLIDNIFSLTFPQFILVVAEVGLMKEKCFYSIRIREWYSEFICTLREYLLLGSGNCLAVLNINFEDISVECSKISIYSHNEWQLCLKKSFLPFS